MGGSCMHHNALGPGDSILCDKWLTSIPCYDVAIVARPAVVMCMRVGSWRVWRNVHRGVQYRHRAMSHLYDIQFLGGSIE